MQVGLVDVEGGTKLLWSSLCSGGASYRYVPFFALHLHFFQFICSPLFGSGRNSMYMHAYVYIRIGTILYAAPFNVNFRAAFVPGSTQLARLGTVNFGKHAVSPQHPQVVTLAAQCATVQEPGLPTRWSFGWPYGGQQNACIFSSNIIVCPRVIWLHMTMSGPRFRVAAFNIAEVYLKPNLLGLEVHATAALLNIFTHRRLYSSIAAAISNPSIPAPTPTPGVQHG